MWRKSCHQLMISEIFPGSSIVFGVDSGFDNVLGEKSEVPCLEKSSSRSSALVKANVTAADIDTSVHQHDC